MDYTEMNEQNSQCYCSSNEVEVYMLTCISCKKKFHPSCLKSGRPSSLAGDIYFTFTCAWCAPDGTEIVKRMKLQWTLVIMLALYNLQLEGSGKCGYFRWREHICRFIDKNWAIIFGEDRKKSATWHGTVAGALSTGANRFFISGFEVLGETGWWSLKSSKMPSIEELDSIALNIKACRKRKNAPELQQTSVLEGGRRKNQNIVEAAVALKEKKSTISTLELKPVKVKKKRSEPKVKQCDSSIFPPNHKLRVVVASTSSSSQYNEESSNQSVPKIIIKTERSSPSPPLECEDSNFWAKDSEILDMPPISDMYDIPNSLDISDTLLEDMLNEMNMEANSTVKQEYDSDDDNYIMSKAAVGTPKKSYPDTSRKRTVITKEESPLKETNVAESKFTLMNPYEEETLLQKLEKYSVTMKENSELRQLYRKLKVRKLKRERNIPVFDIDAIMRSIRGMDPPEYFQQEIAAKPNAPISQIKTVFDRYQVSSSNKLTKSQHQTSFLTRLMGRDIEDQESIVSPYSERILKPFIFRDYKTKPIKVKLLEEILAHTHKDESDWSPPRRYPIDYCYVRPEFIPGVNALCQEFFWPGIDLSECLQYPDFSCVALYRKVIVGFAFMVPDVKYNEAYITFIFCHPEWRRCGIATFMLYHLIQTCTGKDITLHVSATSSAIFLYQKFSFKIEEIIHDFYDKYLPSDSKDCRHALFLRLAR